MLHQNGDLHFATGLHIKVTGAIGFGDLNGYVGTGLFDEPLPDLAGGKLSALTSGQRAVVNADSHGDGGRIDVHERKRIARLGIGDGFTDEDVLKAADPDNVASASLGNVDFCQTLMPEDCGDLALLPAAVDMDAPDDIALLDFSRHHATVSDTTQVIGVVQVGDEELQIIHSRGLRSGDVLNDGVEEGVHVGTLLIDFKLGKTVTGGGVNDRKVELLVCGVELQKELEDHIQHLVWTGVFAVNFVNNNDGLGSGCEGLFEHKLSLRLRAVVGVHH